MRVLSDTPKMAWSKPPADIPLGLITTLKAMGHHDLEVEHVALDLTGTDWRDRVGDLF
jgi:hypothetical protein